jgi:hypothetical protein
VTLGGDDDLYLLYMMDVLGCMDIQGFALVCKGGGLDVGMISGTYLLSEWLLRQLAMYLYSQMTGFVSL